MPGRFGTFVLSALALAVVASPIPAFAGSTGSASLSGSVWQDLDRDGVRDDGEAGFASVIVQLLDANGAWVTGVDTDANGNFTFAGLADGTYGIRVARGDWLALRQDWVPTTTGSLSFSRSVGVTGATSASIGLRPITRSRTLGAPISSVRSSTGTLVESYNDAVTAQDVLDRLQSGGLLGAEAPFVEIRFDYQTGGSCASKVAGSPGSYSGYSADVWVDWLSWLVDGDRTLFHEYGHAFANYHDLIVQQDGTYAGYLAVRGLTGDPRINSDHSWYPGEMIAEDYRLLFGTPSAQAYPQENTDIAPAAAVPGLAAYLRDTFTTPSTPAPVPTATPTSTPDPVPFVVSGVAMDPGVVTTSGTAAFVLSDAASVDVTVVDAGGSVVRTLRAGAAAPAGASALVWDRKTDSGRKARAGTYTLVVRAVDGAGTVASGSSSFTVVDPVRSTKPRP